MRSLSFVYVYLHPYINKIRDEEMTGYLHDGIYSSTVAFPHGPEPGLSTNVPNFYGNITLCYLAHVEAHCWNHVFTELSRLKSKMFKIHF